MDFFLKFLHEEPEIASIVADVQHHFGQASAAICFLSRYLRQVPNSYTMLVKQSQLLVQLGEPENALLVRFPPLPICKHAVAAQCWSFFLFCDG